MAAILPFARPETTIESLRPLLHNTELARDIDRFKQLCFYTNAESPDSWSVPRDVLTEAEATALIRAAELAVMPGREVPFETEAELSLWVRHLKPVWKSGMEAMKHALVACYREAEELGVARGRQSAEGLARFLFGTPIGDTLDLAPSRQDEV